MVLSCPRGAQVPKIDGQLLPIPARVAKRERSQRRIHPKRGWLDICMLFFHSMIFTSWLLVMKMIMSPCVATSGIPGPQA